MLPDYLQEQGAIYRLQKARLQSAPLSLDYSDLHILSKEQTLEPLSLNRIQHDLLNKLGNRNLCLKPRQVGISTAIQAYLFKTAVTQTARVGTMAHDDETTQKLRDMQQLFYDELPTATKARIPRAINNATRAYYPSTKSMVYIGTAGNTQRGRGGTYSHVHGSEVAYWKNAQNLLAGLMQGVPDNGVIILESTANGIGNWFYTQCMAALAGTSEWVLHFYAWWWDETYTLPHDGLPLTYTTDEQALINRHGLTPGQILWRRRKKQQLGRLFDQEYPEDAYTCFLSSGSDVFGDITDALYTPAADDKPTEGHRYFAGLDWGQSDYTALSIIDADENREVFIGRWNRMAWADMRREVLDACAFWQVEKLLPERNSASSNIEDLADEIYKRRLNMSLAPFTMTHKLKGEMVNHLKRGLHEDGLKLIDNPAATSELRAWETKQTDTGLWVYTHPAGQDGHGDTTIARMAAWRGVLNRISI